MYYLQQIFQVMFDPEYTTANLYDTPRLGDAFIVFSLFTFFYSLDSFLMGYLRVDTFGIGLVSFLATAGAMFLLWVGVGIVFHIAADVLGGVGELPNAFSFVALGTAPLIFTSILKCILTVLYFKVILNDPERIFPKVGLGLDLIGMAWGTPGIFCYFGMKNAEKVHMLKALVVTLIVFFAFAALLAYMSDVF